MARKRIFRYRRSDKTGRFTVYNGSGKKLITVRNFDNIYAFLDGYTGTKENYNLWPKRRKAADAA